MAERIGNTIAHLKNVRKTVEIGLAGVWKTHPYNAMQLADAECDIKDAIDRLILTLETAQKLEIKKSYHR